MKSKLFDVQYDYRYLISYAEEFPEICITGDTQNRKVSLAFHNMFEL